MAAPQTLLALSGASLGPTPLSQAALVVIDAQNEYLDGRLPLQGIEAAVEEVARLLERARRLGRPILHVRHRGQPGGAFDPEARGGQIIEAVAPLADETIVEKTLPNAFAGTELMPQLARSGTKQLVVAGFMTHLCVSTSVRAAIDHRLFSTVVASACATRDLPSATGGEMMPARMLHEATLAALADRFAVVVPDAGSLPD